MLSLRLFAQLREKFYDLPVFRGNGKHIKSSDIYGNQDKEKHGIKGIYNVLKMQ